MNLGDMTPEQRDAAIRDAVTRLKTELESPAFAAAIDAPLPGEKLTRAPKARAARKPRPTQFALGYQAALRDIRSAMEHDGLTGVEQWLANNLARGIKS